MTNRGMFRLIGGIFAPIGLALLGAGVYTGVQKHRVIRDWPLADATVVQSRTVSYTDDEGTDMHRAVVDFRYTVDGRLFTTPAESDYSSSSHTEMQKLVNRFPPGSVRPIKYNPRAPDQVSFTYGYNFGFFFVAILLGGMGLVFTGIGALVVWIGARSRGLSCHQCGQPVETGQRFCPNCAAPVSPFPQ